MNTDVLYVFRAETIKSALDILTVVTVSPKSQLALLDSIPMPDNVQTPVIRYV